MVLCIVDTHTIFQHFQQHLQMQATDPTYFAYLQETFSWPTHPEHTIDWCILQQVHTKFMHNEQCTLTKFIYKAVVTITRLISRAKYIHQSSMPILSYN